ncbi:MAG: NTP transferase domain-containing protein [bacterium]|nr:NTP transferase domain-containing protein [bacterium]
MTEPKSTGSIASIILCAGKGRRMGTSRTPKVCFPVAGKAAVAHMLERLEGLGITTNIMVVGHLGGMVVDEIGPQFPQALFAYQKELLGTGHATKQGAAMLQTLGFEGGILVVAGDKFVEPHALQKMIDAFHAQSADVALLVAPKNRWPSAGRIVTGADGGVRRIIENADIRDARETGRTFDVDGESLSADDVEERVEWVNQAVYLFSAESLFHSLAELARDNAQNEEYLTDTIDHLVDDGCRVVPVPVDDPEDCLGFNSPSELIEIEEHFRHKMGLDVTEQVTLDPRIFKPAKEWAARLREPDHDLSRLLCVIYGKDTHFQRQKRLRLLETVELFIDRFGPDGDVAVIRAPGRVNLMGRHVDHRGGCVNLLAIDREHILVARRRADTKVRARNADAGKFEDLEFTMDDLLRQVRLDDWREFVNSETVVDMVRDLQGGWGNYLKAPMLRLQQEFKTRRILGLDCVVSGDIPVAAGLSSSSALVVAMGEALSLVNGLDVAANDLVDLCGEGEWFVGTRGGSADHAAVKLSQYGQVANVSFFPFAINEYLPFPKGYSLVICNSRVQARKAAGARNAFNERIASYEFAVELVKKRFPNYAPLIHHLRDITPSGLGVRAADIYRILLDVPESATVDELRAEIGDDLVDRVLASHAPQPSYALRGRLLFGIAECERSRHCVKMLREGDLERFGSFMNISHDGDRVAAAQGEPYHAPSDDMYLRRNIESLHSEDPDGVLAGQLYSQPGSYACSIPAIDRMVDIALGTPGALGAQISGAGLGGCMMVLAPEDAAELVIKRLHVMYYEPNNMEPDALAITPIAGCSPLVAG